MCEKCTVAEYDSKELNICGGKQPETLSVWVYPHNGKFIKLIKRKWREEVRVGVGGLVAGLMGLIEGQSFIGTVPVFCFFLTIIFACFWRFLLASAYAYVLIFFWPILCFLVLCLWFACFAYTLFVGVYVLLVCLCFACLYLSIACLHLCFDCQCPYFAYL